MASLWLAALLLAPPVSVLLHRDQDPNPPITNVRMEPRTKRLTWDLRGNVSSIECVEGPTFDTKAENNLFCQFYLLPKCTRTNYTVKVAMVDGEPYSTWIEYPKQEGNPAAAAEGLACEVHDKDALTCRWAVGRAAPSDVQYYFHLEHSSTAQRWACPRYLTNEGKHTACRFDNISAFYDPKQHLFYQFWVTGTSHGDAIPCSELFSDLSKIEKLIAPNISASCNKTLALLEWDMSSHLHKHFDYELQIGQGADTPSTHKVEEDKSFRLTNPGTFTVKIRARTSSPDLIGHWSAPQHFVCDPGAGALSHVWLSSSLMALATLLTVGTAVFLCRRYSVLKTLFPPIPHLKDPIGGSLHNEKMFTWEAGRPSQEECPVAELQVLRET
ncbi:interleukin-3 receptor subunit alpha [Myotis daubentonii]|uniref:interleukin-3 receptor subunit alpha n=1 Tax=Myotis daubentonii TaxID=98922 RepID=UPI002872D347|nr:interleukin-3 receptor subunit alpha [Myotis daubentonii]